MKCLSKNLLAGGIASLLIMTAAGTLCGASVTVLREGPPEGGRESAVVQDAADSDGKQRLFAPRKARDKSESGSESDTRSRPAKMERYKPYQEGVGEKRTRP